MKHKILLVDDEPANLRSMERLFRDAHDIITANSGSEALELLGHIDVALIISDQRMPGMTGLEFLKQAAKIRQSTVRIILTGYTDVGDLVEAINSGVVYKYITKPWINSDLLQTIQRAIEHYEVSRKQHSLLEENLRLEERLQTSMQGFVTGLGEFIAQKSLSLADHCRRTSQYAALIGKQLDLVPDDLDQLTFACLLHEMPNLAVPFSLSLSKTALTPDQCRTTRDTYEKGLRLISGVPDLHAAARTIRFQHERFDGTGLFDGLAGESIPLLSRILAVANAFDEITCGLNGALLGPDRKASSTLRARAGTHLDPLVVEACLVAEPVEPSWFSYANRGTAPPRISPRPLSSLDELTSSCHV